MCDLDYLEPFDFYTTYERRARKSYQCDCCLGMIQPKEKYRRVSFKFDGEVATEKLCAECIKDEAVFTAKHDGVFTNPSALKDLLHECLSNEGQDDEGASEWALMLWRMKERATQVHQKLGN